MADRSAALNDGIFVIFGITGDLAKRKLLPSLYQLLDMGLLSERFRIVGTTRRATEIDEVIAELKSTLIANNIHANDSVLKKLQGMMRMVHMDIAKTEDYGLLKQELDKIEDDIGLCLNRLFYMAVPPNMFEQVVTGLGTSSLNNGCQHQASQSRLLIEKPFGSNTTSAIELIKKLETVFTEQSIYRVDHYLAKETVQNILTFRLNNPIFRAIWDRHSIDSIVITASEQIGIEGRANFYEGTGALRDLIQSHLLQLLALTTMEDPNDRSSEAIHAAKLTLLEAITPIAPADVDSQTVRGQYATYKTEVGNPNSQTETYAAITLAIDNERWRGVHVLLQTGKAMAEKRTEITLTFKSRVTGSTDKNRLTLRVQPDEGINLSLLAKKPSLINETEIVQMGFSYSSSFSGTQPDAYERVLVDAIRGDKTLFTTDKEVLASWLIIDGVLQEWADNKQPLLMYDNGSNGLTETTGIAKSDIFNSM
ncbi:MAG: glucose-6-phosphate dehydrogenase [Candidatus Saccharimonadales bacterium]